MISMGKVVFLLVVLILNLLVELLLLSEQTHISQSGFTPLKNDLREKHSVCELFPLTGGYRIYWFIKVLQIVLLLLLSHFSCV